MEFPKIDEVYKLLSEKLESWVEGGITLLPNIVVAFFIAIAFGIFAKVIGNVAGKIMRRTFESRQIASLLTSIIKSIVLIAGIFIALDFVGLKGTVTSLRRRRYRRVGHWFCVSGHDGKLHCRCGHGNSKTL